MMTYIITCVYFFISTTLSSYILEHELVKHCLYNGLDNGAVCSMYNATLIWSLSMIHIVKSYYFYILSFKFLI